MEGKSDAEKYRLSQLQWLIEALLKAEGRDQSVAECRINRKNQKRKQKQK